VVRRTACCCAVEISQAEAWETIPAFSFKGSDPGFRKRVGAWIQEEGSQAADAGAVKETPECRRELAAAVIRNADDPVAAEPAVEGLDLGFQEAGWGFPARGAGFNKQVQNDVEPARHRL
jgi:hypothetical protein